MNSPLQIPEVNAVSFERDVLRCASPVLVAVFADGHSTSQRLLTLLETWTTEVRGRVNVVRVNAAETPTMVQPCGLPSAPGLALFHRGVVCYQFTGEVSRRELDDLLA